MTNLHVPHEIKVDAVRLRAQGHTVTQVTLTNLQFESVNDGTVYAARARRSCPRSSRRADDWRMTLVGACAIKTLAAPHIPA